MSREAFEAWWFTESTVDALENAQDLHEGCRIAWQAAYAAGQKDAATKCRELCGKVYGPWDTRLSPERNARRVADACADAIAREFSLE